MIRSLSTARKSLHIRTPASVAIKLPIQVRILESPTLPVQKMKSQIPEFVKIKHVPEGGKELFPKFVSVISCALRGSCQGSGEFPGHECLIRDHGERFRYPEIMPGFAGVEDRVARWNLARRGNGRQQAFFFFAIFLAYVHLSDDWRFRSYVMPKRFAVRAH